MQRLLREMPLEVHAAGGKRAISMLARGQSGAAKTKAERAQKVGPYVRLGT